MTGQRRLLVRISFLVLAGSLAGAATLLGACSEVAEQVFTPPRASLRGISLGAIGTNGPSLDVVVLLENPNPYALTATRARYRLVTADSTEIGSGVVDREVTVAANDSARVVLPVSLGWDGLGAAGGELFRGTAVDVDLTGDVTVRTPVGERVVPLRARRRVEGLRR